MREIKFRAWVPEVSKMIPWRHLNLEMEDGYGGVKDHVDDALADVEDQVTSHFELMQYTGLKDRNGKEIYEGDILKVPDLYETPENTNPTYNNQYIHFKNCSFYLGDQSMVDDHQYISDECEVIGNIHENPELLEAPHG